MLTNLNQLFIFCHKYIYPLRNPFKNTNTCFRFNDNCLLVRCKGETSPWLTLLFKEMSHYQWCTQSLVTINRMLGNSNNVYKWNLLEMRENKIKSIFLSSLLLYNYNSIRIREIIKFLKMEMFLFNTFAFGSLTSLERERLLL